MARTLRGANSPNRVKRQKIHAFNMTETEAEAKTKDELEEIAEDLDVYDQIPATGESSDPLKSDLVEYLVGLSHQSLS